MTSTDHDDPFDLGLEADLATINQQRQRRAVLGLLGGGLAAAVGGAVLLRPGTANAATSVAGRSASSCASDEIPSETAGPYPGDGSNGPDVLAESGVVRRDIRSSIGGATGKAKGVPLKIRLVLQSTDTCKPLEGMAVYLWHCDRKGRYSMYSEGVEDENYLRGVQVSNANGVVRFRSIYPACYSGRWPHIHFEVYESRHAATHGGTPVVTSQIALPRKESMHVYRHAKGYDESVTNLNRVSLGTDNVFGDDGGVRELGTVTGSLKKGYRVRLVVPVDA
ncbi:MAG: 3,4-dioxygenase subunit beta [Nocardioides sp.]|uniref:dioxygenase family protein n=1 Tax=Nocardioides sp. TaxID=35761 RepID=UPI0039E3E216